MAMDIHLYLTTRKDGMPDLKSHKDVEEVRRWFSKVGNVAVHHSHFSEVRDDIIREASPHPILEGHSVIFYCPGELLDADEIGEELKVLFKKHHHPFDWHVAANPNLKPKNYEVLLEIIVKD